MTDGFVGFDFDHTLGIDNHLERSAFGVIAKELGAPIDIEAPVEKALIERCLTPFRDGAIPMSTMLETFAQFAALAGVAALRQASGRALSGYLLLTHRGTCRRHRRRAGMHRGTHCERHSRRHPDQRPGHRFRSAKSRARARHLSGAGPGERHDRCVQTLARSVRETRARTRVPAGRRLVVCRRQSEDRCRRRARVRVTHGVAARRRRHLSDRKLRRPTR